MPRKKQSHEETLAKARLARRNRYAKIKADPALYALEREKERKRYIKRKEEKKILSASELTPRARRIQRRKWRENFRRQYQRKLLEKKRTEEVFIPISTNEGNVDDKNSYELRNSFNTPQPSTSLDIDHKESVTQNLKKKIRTLKKYMANKAQKDKIEIELLKKKNNKYKKIILRLRKRLQSPNTKAKALLQDKTKIEEAKKKILFGEAMKKTLEGSYKALKSNTEKRAFHNTIMRKKNILKKHKVLSEAQNFLLREKKQPQQKKFEYEKLKQDIQDFFERDNVSRATAGKKEFITGQKERKQKRYLLDNMKNLHKVFESEFRTVSYSYFCKQRPYWVLIPSVNQRDTCVCKMHANMELLIQALYKRRIIKHASINDVVNFLCCGKNKCLIERCNLCANKTICYEEFDNKDLITFKQWQNSTTSYESKGIKKNKRIISKTKITTNPKEAVELLEQMIPKFLKHEGLRRWQFSAMRGLRENLKDAEVIIHIDFSENYALKYESEVQAFHFGGSRQELSLQTAVVYFIDKEGKFTNKTFCTVSENLRHDSAAVWGHLIPLLEFVKLANNNITTLHFLSDSPSSQYRNKTMFYVISKLYWYFDGLKRITWNYTESAHGKGAADGVGAVVKRTADAAVAQGNDVATIEDFLRVVKENTQNINMATIDEYHIIEKDLLISSEKLLNLKGTMKVHQVLWQKETKSLIFREASCFSCVSTCKHTTFVGKLLYKDPNHPNVAVIENNENNNRQTNPDTKPMRAATNTSNEPKVKIISNVLLNPRKNRTFGNSISTNVTMLSDTKLDNKMHLDPNIKIEEMVNIYNISGSEANFSGIYQEFIQSSELEAIRDRYETDTFQTRKHQVSVSESEKCQNDDTDSDISDYNIF